MDQFQERLVCPVCFDRFDVPKQLPCQHTFCFSCLSGLAKKPRLRCPECRAEHDVPANGPAGFATDLTMVRFLQIDTGNAIENRVQPKRERQFSHELKEIIPKVDERIADLKNGIEKLNVSQCDMIKELEDWVALCTSEIQEKKKKAMKEILAKTAEKQRMLSSEQESFEIQVTKLKSIRDDKENTYVNETDIVKAVEESKQSLEMTTENIDGIENELEINKKELDSTLQTIKDLKVVKEKPKKIKPAKPPVSSKPETNSKAPPVPPRDPTSREKITVFRNKPKKPFVVKAYVTSTQTHASGRQSRCFSSYGTSTGLLCSPEGLSRTPCGNVVVTDTGNHRIQIFKGTGQLLRFFGKCGTGLGELSHPRDCCVTASKQVIVADTENSRVVVFDLEGNFLRTIGEDDEISFPCSVASSGEYIFVTDNTASIKMFTHTGKFYSSFGKSWLSASGSEKYIALTNLGEIIVVDTTRCRVGIFDHDGNLYSEFGTEGAGENQFKYPRGVACDTHGSIFIADSGNHRVQVVSKEGEYLATLGCRGKQPGQLLWPAGVTVLKNGEIVVSEANNHRIQIF